GPAESLLVVERVGRELPGEGPSGTVLPGGAVRPVLPLAEARDSALAGGAVTARARRVEDGVEITVTASSTVRDLCVLADRVDPAATVDRQLVTLLAGESARLHVRTSAPVDADAFVAEDVLLSANDLVARAQDRAARPVAG